MGLPAERPPHVACMAYPTIVLVVDFNLPIPDNGQLQRIMDVGAIKRLGPDMIVPIQFERMGGSELRMAVGHDIQFRQVAALGVFLGYVQRFTVRNDNFSRGMYNL